MAAGSGSGKAAGVNPYLTAADIGGGALTALLSSISAANERKRNEQMTREGIQANRESDIRDLASKESTLDPFRQQMMQAGDISKLDRIERGSYSPVHMTPSGPYASYVPQMSGGFNYSKSPELIQSAAALKRNVMGGNTAPTMTDPTNYGKTAALDLVRIASDRADPASVNASGAPPRSVGAYTEGVQTRTAGGLGASETRSTDVTVQQAQQILDRAFRSELGRAPQPGEINQLLASQGLKPGDRWVGSGGLNGILNSLRSQAQAAPMQPSYTGH